MPDKVPCQAFADPLPWPLGRCLQRSGRGVCQFRRIRIPREDGAQQLSSFNARVSKCATQQLSVRPANGCERSPRRHQPGSQRWPSAAPILSIRRRAIISGGPSRRCRHDDFDRPVREACAARKSITGQCMQKKHHAFSAPLVASKIPAPFAGALNGAKPTPAFCPV